MTLIPPRMLYPRVRPGLIDRLRNAGQNIGLLLLLAFVLLAIAAAIFG